MVDLARSREQLASLLCLLADSGKGTPMPAWPSASRRQHTSTWTPPRDGVNTLPLSLILSCYPLDPFNKDTQPAHRLSGHSRFDIWRATVESLTT